MTNDQEQALHAYHRGEIDGNTMLRRTLPRWRALAGKLYKEWQTRLPCWVDDKDVFQVVCEAVLRFAREYDPSYGTSMRWYVVHNAADKGEKAIHKWRNAIRSGNAAAHPSRMETPLSVYSWGEGDDEADTGTRLRKLDPERMSIPPAQEQSAEAQEFFNRVLATARTVREAVALLALRASGGSLVHAAELIYADPASRLECELGNENEAHRLVKLMMSDIEQRYTVLDET